MSIDRAALVWVGSFDNQKIELVTFHSFLLIYCRKPWIVACVLLDQPLNSFLSCRWFHVLFSHLSLNMSSIHQSSVMYEPQWAKSLRLQLNIFLKYYSFTGTFLSSEKYIFHSSFIVNSDGRYFLLDFPLQ